MKILIVEDDFALLTTLRRALKSIYLTDTAMNGREAITLCEINSYDAIILDLNLPDLDGLSVCKELRSKGLSVPILILTGANSITTKVELLDAGANDYVTKPVSLEELKARIRVLIRGHKANFRTSQLSISDLVLDTSTRSVYRSGRPIRLRRKEFDLLEYLMHNIDKVVTRAMILDHVWDGGDSLWTNAVDVHIKHLRDHIDRGTQQPLIKTIHGVGYKLESPSNSAIPL